MRILLNISRGKITAEVLSRNEVNTVDVELSLSDSIRLSFYQFEKHDRKARLVEKQVVYEYLYRYLLRCLGFSYPEIAKECGVHYSSVMASMKIVNDAFELSGRFQEMHDTFHRMRDYLLEAHEFDVLQYRNKTQNSKHRI
jgi:hypothetical protein